MEHPSLLGFLTDEIFVGLVFVGLIALGVSVVVSNYRDIVEMCDPSNQQKRRITMYTVTYTDLVLEEGEIEDFDKYFEAHAVSYTKTQGEFCVDYAVTWPDVKSSYAFYSWALHSALALHNLDTHMAIDACKKYLPIKESL